MNSQQLTRLLMQVFITPSGRTDRGITDEQPTADSATDAGIHYTKWTDRQTDRWVNSQQLTQLLMQVFITPGGRTDRWGDSNR